MVRNEDIWFSVTTAAESLTTTTGCWGRESVSSLSMSCSHIPGGIGHPGDVSKPSLSWPWPSFRYYFLVSVSRFFPGCPERHSKRVVGCCEREEEDPVVKWSNPQRKIHNSWRQPINYGKFIRVRKWNGTQYSHCHYWLQPTLSSNAQTERRRGGNPEWMGSSFRGGLSSTALYTGDIIKMNNLKI